MTALLPVRQEPPEFEPIHTPVVVASAVPPAAWRYFVSPALITVAAILLGLTLNVTGISWAVHRSAQKAGLDALRVDLARATAPVGQLSGGKLLPLGTPVAVLRIPAIGLDEVVFEGTTGGVLMSGPGHQRDTALPGQAGTAIIQGRAAAYGGPFGRLDRLMPEDRITVLTGQGESTYRVTGSRRAGDAVPPPVEPGSGRLTLVTAAGTPFLPTGVLRVDAELVSTAYPNPPRALPAGSIDVSETALAVDASINTMWVLVLGLQGLLAAAAGATWSRRRWGAARTWIVFAPLISVFGLLVAEHVVRLLPNLL
ncbi:sortase [Dactylosporangium siamense]|uniref:Sortase n=1 Tax=Dactylosporangium siamense TaxID=685454 RepID=A0A919UIZ5_9ACTN|nr:class E sortase [Dactylosporangium siamense]GIG52153.1 sortase [Dactylosporangium siamense]